MWQVTIEAALEGKAETSVAEVLADILKIEPKAQAQRDMMEVTKILGRLGFTQSPNRPLRNGKRVRVYVRKLPEPVEAVEPQALTAHEDDALRLLLRNGWTQVVLSDGTRTLRQAVEDPKEREFALYLVENV